MMLVLAACCRSSEIRANPLCRSFDFVGMTHHRTAAAVLIVPGTAECCCSTETARSAGRERAHRPRWHRSVFASTGPFPVRVICVRAIPILPRNQRSRRTFIAWIFQVPRTFFVRKCNQHLVSLKILYCNGIYISG